MGIWVMLPRGRRGEQAAQGPMNQNAPPALMPALRRAMCQR